jgi:hypothetical protein
MRVRARIDEDTGPQAPGELWVQAGGCFTRWADGDPAGLDDLVRVMTPVLWHVVRAYRLPQDMAEDIIQTTWLALVRRREVAVAVWVRRISWVANGRRVGVPFSWWRGRWCAGGGG